MNYNLSALQENGSTVLTLVRVTNDASQGLLVAGILVAVFLVQASLFSRSQAGTLASFTYSAWLTFFYTLMLNFAATPDGTLVNFWWLLAFGVTAAGGTWMLYLQRNP